MNKDDKITRKRRKNRKKKIIFKKGKRIITAKDGKIITKGE